ncbi:MAG TPA: peptidylprolyl isomerase [Steroidobacteraceae bacterium]|nr:peptidylprolyl isomerase [Steroidobacteraceae bacterium]
MKKLLLGLVLITAAIGGACPAALAAKSAGAAPVRPLVEVDTSLGNFTIQLFPDRSPLTVANFLKYVARGQYTDTLFHRVIANFVIQGGGYDTHDQLKPAPFRTFNESGNGLTNQRGTVGLARSAPPHSGNCQFYVNLNDNSELDPSAARWGYAVFGRVVQGMDVVDRIGNQPTGAAGPFKSDAPVTPVVIEKIVLLKSP